MTIDIYWQTSQVVLMVKNLPANAGDMKRTFNPWMGKILEEGMATHSSILAWTIPWSEELDGLQEPMGHKRVKQDWSILASHSTGTQNGSGRIPSTVFLPPWDSFPCEWQCVSRSKCNYGRKPWVFSLAHFLSNWPWYFGMLLTQNMLNHFQGS